MNAPIAAADRWDALFVHPHVKRAREILRRTDAETLRDMRAAVRIPAPALGESERARWLSDRLSRSGAAEVRTDAAGNVIARLSGAEKGPAVYVAAHLDTVFPADTPIHVIEREERIAAPGIADNARGLAVLVALARALSGAQLPIATPVVLVGSVGEEGIGDLRGMKHLFAESAHDVAAFIALDGTGIRRIVHRAVGSRRLRFSVRGPGGHSWADRGAPNPILALALAAAALDAAAPDADASASLTIGRIAGGTSVNAIPESAWMELDVRAEEREQIEELEALARRALQDAIARVDGGRRAGAGRLFCEVSVIGDRPCGATPADDPLVRAARAATRIVGERAELVASSTDANVPIALGIPAIALGAGGESARTHTLDEWYSNERGPEGAERALLTVVAAAGLD